MKAEREEVKKPNVIITLSHVEAETLYDGLGSDFIWAETPHEAFWNDLFDGVERALR